MTSGELVLRATEDLRTDGVPHPRRDALLLMADLLGEDLARVMAHPEREVSGSGAGDYRSKIERRRSREPLQYIRGFHEFWGMRILVGPGVLIPRPETEHIVETALEFLHGVRNPRVAEAGVGSGCILKALAKEVKEGGFVGIDSQSSALGWARTNLAGDQRVLLLLASFEDPAPLSGINLVVSNPPYISDKEWPGLPPEVREHEPQSALRTGPEPLGPYRHLAAWAAGCLKPGGYLVAEIGAAQAVRHLALRSINPMLEWMGARKDLAGRLRVAVWKKV